MSMFCFQCEEAAKGTGCTNQGVCGKTQVTAILQDKIIAGLVNMAAGTQTITDELDDIMTQGLFMTLTNVNFDDKALTDKLNEIEKNTVPVTNTFTAQELWQGNEDIRSLRSTLIMGLKGVAAYYHHAKVLGEKNPDVSQWIFKAMAAVGQEHTPDQWLDLLMECGKINFLTMEILDKANTTAYGDPEPTEVSFTIDPGPFIVVTGHDLKDLNDLLEQTADKGVNIYTHSDMLPAHGYPQLKKHPHFKGNYGTAWHNQRQEFDNIPGALLYTTNCIQRPKDSYLDRIFTTAAVGFPQTCHIEQKADGTKDFTPVIEKAIALGGYDQPKVMTGINGGKSTMTGFGHKAILSQAGTIVEAVQKGDIKHFFLVGGCDGHRDNRNYYRDFVKATPDDTVILTLACGKFRFNDLDLGNIGGIPRLLDMGQCNDAYGAVKVALALAEAFKCGVNNLPLTLVLSWYEQKAISIVLSLLYLGVKNIYVGPSLPAFFSENVLNILVDKFALTPITDPEADLAKMLNK